MGSESSVNLQLPFIMPSQAQANVTHNEALIRLDGTIQLSAADRTHTAPPETPDEGDRYVVAASAAGDFAGHENEVAYFADGAWMFLVPRPGWLCWIVDEARMLVWHAGGWQVMAGETTEQVSLLGINTAADAANRLVVRAEASLFTHDGDDHRLKLNKNAVGDTASLLFQNGFSGRAEIGLVGDDDLVVKVSPDGSAFSEAIRIAAATGLVSLNAQQPQARIYSANATWTRPAGLKKLLALVVGGGGGGGGTIGNGGDSGAGGGAGGAAVSLIDATGLASSEAVTVGQGGAGGVGVSTSSAAGGTSSFGAHCSASGGTGGISRAASATLPAAVGGLNGLGSGGNLWNAAGGCGWSWLPPLGDLTSGSGGASLLGAGANGVNPSSGVATAGKSALSPGGGGGGAAVRGSTSGAANGGNGADGRVILIELH